MENSSIDARALRMPARQVHLDASGLGMVDGAVAEAVEVERAVQLAVDARQQIEVERGGDASGVVVGGVENARVLLQVDADQQRAGRSEPIGEASQHPHRLRRMEVADGRTREEAQTGRLRERLRQTKRAGKVGVQGRDGELGIIPRQRFGRGEQMLTRDVDGYVARRSIERFQQQPHLDAGAAAELQKDHARRQHGSDVARPRLQDLGLGPCEIVFVQLADTLEQAGSFGVVEELAGDLLARPGQTRDDRGAKLLGRVDVRFERQRAGRARHASRPPRGAPRRIASVGVDRRNCDRSPAHGRPA